MNTLEAVFLDRDGTLIVDRDYLADPEAVELLPGVADAVKELYDAGVALYLFTNQSGVARGYFTVDVVRACNARMVEQFGLGPDLFADVCIATEHPQAASGGYRKPSPRFINEVVAAKGYSRNHCVMLGDRRSDWEAGVNAGTQVAALSCGKAITDNDSLWLKQQKITVYSGLAEWLETKTMRY